MGLSGGSGLTRNSGQRLRMVRPCTRRQTLPNEGGRAGPCSEISVGRGLRRAEGHRGKGSHVAQAAAASGTNTAGGQARSKLEHGSHVREGDNRWDHEGGALRF